MYARTVRDGVYRECIRILCFRFKEMQFRCKQVSQINAMCKK